MPYITNVRIENFQSHKDTQLNLANDLNVITGPSDSGKSAIIRAIRWVLYNEPRGTEFITANEKECRVTLVLSNGISIIRERTSSKNRYILIQDDEKQIFEGFGNTVPQEIINTHQIKNIYLDTDQRTSINLSNQLEGPFLLSESGATRAKAIGRVLGIHYLDAGARKVTANIGELKREYTNKLLEKNDLENRIKDYEIYEDYKEQLDITKENYSLLLLKYKFLETLVDYKSKLSTLNKETVKTEGIIHSTSNLEKLESTMEAIVKISHMHSIALQFNKRLVSTTKEIESSTRLIEKTSHIEELNANIVKCEALVNKLEKYKDLFKRVKENKLEIQKLEKVLSNTTNIAALQQNINASNNLSLQIKSLKPINEKLMVCNSDINKCVKVINLTEGIQHITPNLEKIKLLQENIHKSTKYKETYFETNQRIQNGKKYVKTLDSELSMVLKSYQNKILNLKECPVCENTLDRARAKRLVEKWREV
ncbi:AAA family ATPase [Alkalicella caledoniensis]|uniref:Nuclease SbcCD subunit C n=1 Tax=Alkalicella caledoniensis TaxID=2731377 RepID=A0A7G9WCT8_ALKCA|nr:AAA family ATPase [Alkalicella caledoniensis]QNO16500.1 AAA family ATPase [Alkalicella caledoniensis]